MTSDQDTETTIDLYLENTQTFALPTNVELNTFSSEEEVTKARVDNESLHTENLWSKDYEDVTAGYSKEPVTEAPDESSIFNGKQRVQLTVFVFLLENEAVLISCDHRSANYNFLKGFWASEQAYHSIIGAWIIAKTET